MANFAEFVVMIPPWNPFRIPNVPPHT